MTVAETEELDIAEADPLAAAQRQMAQPLQEMEDFLSGIIDSTVRIIPEVSHHLMGSGGKRIRPMLLMWMTRACGGDPRQGVQLAAATELIHNSTLLHDDVVDRGQFRRGVPAAPVVYGNSASVLVGDYLMAKAIRLVVEHGELVLVDELSKAVSAMAEGEILQLIRSGRFTLSLAGYEEVISGKTAGLFSWCCRCGASLGRVTPTHIEQAAKYGQEFGMAFQICDDVIDYVSPPEQSGKDLASDIKQGKTTLPLLLACEEDGELFSRLEELSSREPTERDCEEILYRVKRTTAISRSLAKGRDFATRAMERLEGFPDGFATERLRELAAYIVNRVEGP